MPLSSGKIATLSMSYPHYFKILNITFKAIYNMSPSYISNLVSIKPCSVYSLRSNSSLFLDRPKGRMLSTFSLRASSLAVGLRGCGCSLSFSTPHPPGAPEPRSPARELARRLIYIRSSFIFCFCPHTVEQPSSKYSGNSISQHF